MTSKLVVNTIEADTGISSVSFASSISLSSTSKFHFSAAGIDIDADTNVNRPAAGVLGFNINSSEKMRLDSSGRLLIGTTTEGNESADELTINSSGNTGVTVRSGSSSNGSLFFSDTTSGAAEYVGFVQYQHASNIMIFGTSSTERLRITSDGSIGINATTPSAGDLATGDSQNTPLLHVYGSGASATTGEYNLLARFEAGTDADSTGAMIVINHANDRGLAIQGGRRTGNYAHGALKMIDNVGRLSNAIFIHGGAGQGVNHMGFYTGESTTTTERLYIANDGAIKACHNGGAFGVGGTPINKFGITTSDNNFFGLHRTNATTGTGEFNINVEANSQVTFSIDDEGAFSLGTTTDPSAQSSYAEKFRIDNKGNLKTGTVPSALNFTDSNSGATRFIEIGSNQGDALLVTHSAGYGVGYFGYERGGDRLVIACDNGGGGNKIDFIPNAGTSTGGGTDNLGGKAPNMRLIPDGSLYAGGTIVLESDMNWTHDTYQRPHIFSGVTGGNPSDGSIVVASPETNPSNTRIGSIVFGCKTSSTTGVSNSGLKAVIDCYTNPNVSDAWKTGAAINFSVRRDNGELENKFQITRDGIVVRRQDSGNEGGEVMLCRPSDDTPHFHIDAFGASGTPSNSNDWVNNANPKMRVHTGGTEIFNLTTGGNIKLPHNPIFCGVYQDGSSTNVNSDPVIFNDTVYINKGAGQTGSGTPYNTSNGYFTCPSAGYYQVYVQAHLQDQASGIYSTWRIYHNTTIVSNAWEGETGGGSLVASVIVNVAGGDTLRATFVSNDTTQYTNETYWVLHILKVG